MKFKLTIFLLVIAFASIVSGQTPNGGFVSGMLLKANGKSLPYTEIELVPTFSDTQIQDQRFLATSDGAGKFSFLDVPNGEYTLSINFDEKPSEMSPYETFFFPNTSNRAEAKKIKIVSGSVIAGLNFQIPAPLIQRRVTGRVVGADGRPASNAFVYLRDVAYDKSLTLDIRTDKSGNFSLIGFESRKYQIGALLYEQLNPSVADSPAEMVASAYSPIFTLAVSNPHFTLVLEETDEVKKSREKNIGIVNY